MFLRKIIISSFLFISACQEVKTIPAQNFKDISNEINSFDSTDLYYQEDFTLVKKVEKEFFLENLNFPNPFEGKNRVTDFIFEVEDDKKLKLEIIDEKSFKIIGLETGKTTFKMKLKNKQQKAVVFKLNIDEGILTSKPQVINLGQTYKLNTYYFYKETKGIIYKSSNPNLLSIDDKGEMRALAEGKVKIEVFYEKLDEKLKDVFEIEVIKKGFVNLKNSLVFYTYYNDTYGLFKYNPDDKKIELLFPYSEEIFYPDISPDGKTILFSKENSLNKEQLYTIKTNGLELIKLSNDDNSDYAYGNWSSDGEKIVYSFSKNNYLQIFTMNVSEKTSTKLTSNPDYLFLAPKWSPDDKKILFYTKSRKQGAQEAIWIMDSDGNNLKQLTIDTEDSDYYRFPIWSSKGDKIYYFSNKNRKDGIYEIFLDGKNDTIFFNKASDHSPFIFSPDETKIALISSYGFDPYIPPSLQLINPNNTATFVVALLGLSSITWSKY